MSPQDPGRPEDKPEGLSKYIKRMKTVLRPRSGSKRQSLATLPDVAGPSTQSAAPASAPARKSTGAPEQPSMLTDYSVMQQEKARALFAKYGLTLDPGEWKAPAGDVQLTRVTKPIRMRVRRTCHRCDTTFGPEKICVNCQHPRCKKCPRFPEAKEKEDKGYQELSKTKIGEIRSRQRGALPLQPHFKYTGNPAAPIIIPSRSGGQDLVRKEAKQRVRRICHVCDTTFVKGSKECAECKHTRCKKCPREPPKLDKYPDGYPGDAEPPKLKPERAFKKPQRRVHYICHVCETQYNVGANVCSKCGQAKCAATIRIPPKKIKREPDPEVVRNVEAKIQALALRDTND
ncbi:hypothetical protein N7532_005326 [Penicillium argentinense]|uniref:Uncharacterized protein n=1 Tax=Penicillium argentinense TaxID=1131581 RepID=A0A9W9K9V5_9EURO|nr:uncharacterized protein N7532_005326 [Penicillium argentinense]KAJ5098325.1 hypothetical protein N7532_005326 [Penicillium argentinense]